MNNATKKNKQKLGKVHFCLYLLLSYYSNEYVLTKDWVQRRMRFKIQTSYEVLSRLFSKTKNFILRLVCILSLFVIGLFEFKMLIITLTSKPTFLCLCVDDAFQVKFICCFSLFYSCFTTKKRRKKNMRFYSGFTESSKHNKYSKHIFSYVSMIFLSHLHIIHCFCGDF